MAVTDNLPCLTTRSCKSQTECNAVQTPLQLLDQQFASHTRRRIGLFVVRAKLAFQRKVHTLGLLLFAQLQAIADNFGLAVATVLARSEVPLLNGALVRKTPGALQK